MAGYDTWMSRDHDMSRVINVKSNNWSKIHELWVQFSFVTSTKCKCRRFRLDEISKMSRVKKSHVISTFPAERTPRYFRNFYYKIHEVYSVLVPEGNFCFACFYCTTLFAFKRQRGCRKNKRKSRNTRLPCRSFSLFFPSSPHYMILKK